MSTPNALWVRRRAEAHIARWPSTEKHLTRTLERQLQRALARDNPEQDRPTLTPEHRELILAEVARLVDLGLVNDRRWGRDNAASLLRRGHAPRIIAERLRVKGLPGPIIDEVLAELNEHGSPVARAAAAYVRKRRLGPCRYPQPTTTEARDLRQRDLARLARRGIDFDTARRVLALPDAETVHAVELGESALD